MKRAEVWERVGDVPTGTTQESRTAESDAAAAAVREYASAEGDIFHSLMREAEGRVGGELEWRMFAPFHAAGSPNEDGAEMTTGVLGKRGDVRILIVEGGVREILTRTFFQNRGEEGFRMEALLGNSEWSMETNPSFGTVSKRRLEVNRHPLLHLYDAVVGYVSARRSIARLESLEVAPVMIAVYIRRLEVKVRQAARRGIILPPPEENGWEDAVRRVLIQAGTPTQDVEPLMSPRHPGRILRVPVWTYTGRSLGHGSRALLRDIGNNRDALAEIRHVQGRVRSVFNRFDQIFEEVWPTAEPIQ